MKKQQGVYLISLLMVVSLTGCAGKDIREEASGLETVQETPEPTDEPAEEQVESKTDYFSFGFVSDSESQDMDTYVYEKEHIEVPFQLMVKEDTGHDVGFLVFINGVPQKYSIREEVDRQEATMQLFPLDELYEKEYTFLIKPNVGKKGEKLGIYICSIVYPSFQPESEAQPSYQYYGRLGQVVPQQVRFDKAVADSDLHFAESEDGKEIPEEVINAIKKYSLADSIEEHLENSLYAELYQNATDETVMKGEGGKIRLKLRLYGGVEGTYRTTIFVNNQPVSVDGKDMIQSVLEVKKMSEYEFELDLSSYGQMNTIYAVTVPADDAYLEYRPCVKSNSRLLINE